LPRPRQRALALEPGEEQRELAAVHPVPLDPRPDLAAVHLGLAVVGLLPPAHDQAIRNGATQPRPHLIAPRPAAPFQPQPQLRLPEEEPADDVLAVRQLVDEIDEHRPVALERQLEVDLDPLLSHADTLGAWHATHASVLSAAPEPSAPSR